VTRPPVEQVQALLQQGDDAAWWTLALVLGLRGDAPADLAGPVEEVLDALGVDLAAARAEPRSAAVAAQAAAPLLQASAVLRGEAGRWADQPEEALLAQGRASGRGARAFTTLVLPRLPGLAASLATPGARMLDVGTGVGALAVAFAEVLPTVTVVGIDVLPRVLALAAGIVAGSPTSDRVVLREQDVATLDEREVYDLAWLPAPFLPPAAFRAGLDAVVRALKPGGWLMVGHGRSAGDPLADAITRLKTSVYGGTALDDAQAAQRLTGAGLVAVTSVPTPPGAPALTCGRKPG
jgi:SAM-dependent methyltransferase